MEISTKSQKLVDRIIATVGIAGFLFMLILFSNPNWKLSLMGALVAAISFLVLRKRIATRVATFSDKLIGDLGLISNINEMGFKFSTHKNGNQDKYYQWKYIRKISLKNDHDLNIEFENEAAITLKKEFIGYNELLKKIPTEKLSNPAIKAYQKSRFENLKTCKICGFIALKNKECMFCRVDDYSKAKEESNFSEADYLKEEQLEHFSTMGPDEKVNFFPENDPEDLFEMDENWKPIVSEKEVLDFSKKEYWD